MGMVWVSAAYGPQHDIAITVGDHRGDLNEIMGGREEVRIEGKVVEERDLESIA